MSEAIEGLWPAPVSVAVLGEELRLSGPVHLELGPAAEPWADRLLDRLAWLRVRPLAGVAGTAAMTASTPLRVDADPELADEEFLLRTDSRDGVQIAAGSVLGAGHAITTLRQLLPPDAHRRAPIERETWSVPAVRIADRPALPWRGFLLDVARHFMPKDELLRIVDRLAMHRLNRLHLHLTDDHGWRIASEAFPAITELATWRSETEVGFSLDHRAPDLDGTPHGGCYTLADLREITAHARAQGIVVVPEIDLPAHASALLAAVPQVRVPGVPVPEVATTFGPSGRVVSPLPEAREVLATLLAELAGAVDSPYLHLGGDEASLDDWRGSAEVGRYLAERGMSSVERLRVDLTEFLVGEVARMGRQPVVWEEAFQVGGLSAETIVMAWRAETLGLAAMAAGHDVVMMPLDTRYLDYAESLDDGLAIGSGQTIDRVAGYVPSRGGGPGTLLGTQAALWTEYAPDARVRAARMFPRLAVHAAGAWTGQAVPWPHARPALEAHLRRLGAAGVEYRPLDGPLPWQRGGTGRRAATSPLTMDVLAQLAETMLASPEEVSFDDVAGLLEPPGGPE